MEVRGGSQHTDISLQVIGTPAPGILLFSVGTTLPDRLEKVQHRYTRNRMLQGMKELEYLERLKRLGLWTLEERRNRADLIKVFKLSSGNTALSLEFFFDLDTGRRIRGHSVKLHKPHCHKDIRKYFFSLRVVNRWNSLPEEVVLSSSINSFKSHLQRIGETTMGFFMD